MIATLLVLDIVLCFYACLNISKESTVLERIAITVSVFFIAYSIISGICFGFDCFSFTKVLIMQLCLFALWVMVKKEAIVLRITMTIDKALVILLIVGLVFTFQKFEMYYIGQDQGVYQIEAIQMVYDKQSVRHHFEEYDILEKQEDVEVYKNMIEDEWPGFYVEHYGSYPTISQENLCSDITGVFHGIHAYSAILALWGKLFGIKHMMHIDTVFYLCSIVLVFYAMGHVCKKRYVQVMLSLLFALSPLVIWISKSSLSEMPLTLFMAMYVYIFTHPTIKKGWMGIPLLGFSFLHVSFLQVLPMFVLLHFYMYIKQKDKGYLVANMEAAIGLSLGYTVMAYSAPQYFYDNVSRVYIEGIITADNFLIWMYVISMLLIVCSAIWCFSFAEKIRSWLIKYTDGVFWVLCKLFIILCLGMFAYHLYQFGYVKSPTGWVNQYYGSGLSAVGHLGIWAFMMATGFLVVPIITCLALFRFKVFEEDKVNALMILFVYAVFLSSAFIRKEIQYYYYYSRYLVFYLPFILVLGAGVLKQAKKRLNYVIGIFSILFCIPFSLTLCLNKDDTYMTWKVLEDLTEKIGTSSAVIIDDMQLNRIVGLNLRATTGCGIFPLFSDMEEEFQLLSENYDSVYYLTWNGKVLAERGGSISDRKLVYRNYYISQKIPTDSSKELYALDKDIPEEKKEIILFLLE